LPTVAEEGEAQHGKLEGSTDCMKIAHVVDSMEVGGVETLVAQMCRLQREQGHDPSVYVVGENGALGEELLRDGFAVRLRMARSLAYATPSFFRAFKELRPDVVHLHNPTPTIYAALAARMVGVPRVVTTRHGLVSPPHRLAVELRYAVAATCCDSVVGVCDATTNNLKSIHTIPTRKIVRIYNGTVQIQRVAKQECPSKNGFTLVYVGRLAPVKNHVLMLNAFRAACSAMPGLELWMVGDGVERSKLEAFAHDLGINERVTFWGQQLDVAPFLSTADAFIMSSKSEGLPISLLQALSLGLPAVVTNVGGMAEVVSKAKAGIAVSDTDPSEMAAAILRLASSEEEREQFSINAKTSFFASFTLEGMVEAYTSLYQNSP
jgi:glycosyltransferase involved in cell wall biosynthesis